MIWCVCVDMLCVVQALIEAGVVRLMCNMMQSDDVEVRNSACHAVANFSAVPTNHRMIGTTQSPCTS